MSADLFAEFGGGSNSNQQSQPSTQVQAAPQTVGSLDLFEGLSTTPAPAGQTRSTPILQQPSVGVLVNPQNTAVLNDDHDEWGDFEGGGTIETNLDNKAGLYQPQSSNHHWGAPSDLRDSFSDVQKSVPSSWQHAPIVKAKKPTDSNVLFDAEDSIDDDDEFGDFEGTHDIPSSTSAARTSSALDDLLGDMSSPKGSSANITRIGQTRTTSPMKTAEILEKRVVGTFGKVTKQTPAVASPNSNTPKEEEAWDTFDDWEVSDPKKDANKTSIRTDTSKITAASKDLTSLSPVLSPIPTNEPRADELPPTNVPPPGVLLSLFPSFFTEAQDKLFKPMASQTLPMRNKLMAEPTTIEYLRGYLLLANVAAHVIAGRKLRWKRDQHLSQGMRIGPASSRATSGMKLTGIDKGENMKEEREVSDVVRVWKEQVGRLRHVVAGINQIKAGTLGAVADLHEVMPVKNLKQSEGGIPARQPCMLCGLKREERVTAMDLATDDSFGEWWIDQVNMHRGNCAFILAKDFFSDCAYRLSKFLGTAQGYTSSTLIRWNYVETAQHFKVEGC